MSRSNDEHYLQALKDTQSELQAIRESGNALLAGGIIGAMAICAGVAAGAYAIVGPSNFASLDPIWFIAGGCLTFGSAIGMVMAGFLGRQSLRNSRANMLILRASHLLLMPAEAAGSRVETLSESVKTETAKVNELIEGSYASLAKLKDTLTKERADVTKNVERNRASIQEMIEKLTADRLALKELTEAVEQQTATMSDAIPKQARIMVEAAREAQQEVSKADEALQSRLTALDNSGRMLGERLERLDAMTIEGENRAKEIAALIVEVENRLKKSAQTVDSAVKASEIAVSAAAETGDSLNAAVASALDGTREAANFIREQSREAVEDARKAMEELKQAGLSAEAATKSAGSEARAQAEQTEKRIEELSDLMFRAATRATSAAEAGLERARLRIERASALLNGIYDPGADVPAQEPQQPTRNETPPPPAPEKPSLRPRQDEDVTPPKPVTGSPSSQAQAPATQPKQPDPPKSDATHVSREDDDQDDDDAPPMPIAAQLAKEAFSRAPIGEEPDDTDPSTFNMVEQQPAGLSWKDLLAGLETPAEERDESARYVLSEIEQLGITLAGMINAKEIRKIANAARRGDIQRRRTVREQTGAAVQSIMFRLQDDAAFRNATERFVSVEEPDALRALSESEKSRAAASPRLTAYLLLDSAFSSIS